MTKTLNRKHLNAVLEKYAEPLDALMPRPSAILQDMRTTGSPTASQPASSSPQSQQQQYQPLDALMPRPSAILQGMRTTANRLPNSQQYQPLDALMPRPSAILQNMRTPTTATATPTPTSGGTMSLNQTPFSPSMTLSGGSNSITAAPPTPAQNLAQQQPIPQPKPEPALAQQQQPAPAQQQQQSALNQQQPAPAQAPDFDGAMKSYQAAKTPQEQQKVLQDLTKSMQGSIGDSDRAGANDVLAGKMDTPAARAFIDQKLGPAGDEYAKQFVQQEIANKPEVANNPSMFGQLQSMAQNAWQGMGPMGQMAFAFGVPMALIGLMGGGGLTSLLGGLGIGALGLGAAGMGMFGNDARAGVGNMMNNVYGFFSGKDIPRNIHETLSPQAQAEMQLKARNAMDARNPDGTRGGWAAGRKVVQDQVAQADQLLGAPKEVAITSLMGMGAKTPEEAEGLLAEIAKRRDAASAPDFLQNQARAAVLDRLRAADQENNGQLSRFLDVRGQNSWGPGVNWYRQGQILDKFKNNPELQQFLSRDADGNLVLPEGATMEDFADSMLRNAYGDYEQKAGSHNIGRLVFAREFAKQSGVRVCMKSARCWAGYEPVPGKKPYSNDSCRPVGSKKKKTDKKKSNK